MLLVQIAGQTVSGEIVMVDVWNPPIATWPRYTCTINSNGRNYTIGNSLNQCVVGQSAVLKVNPLDANDAWYQGDYLSGRTALAWCCILISLIFGLLGFILRITHIRTPWHTALNWVLDRLSE